MFAETFGCVRFSYNLCVEDLNMQSIFQNLKFGKAVSNNGWGILITFLGYKLTEQGKRLIKIDKCMSALKLVSVGDIRILMLKI